MKRILLCIIAFGIFPHSTRAQKRFNFETGYRTGVTSQWYTTYTYDNVVQNGLYLHADYKRKWVLEVSGSYNNTKTQGTMPSTSVDTGWTDTVTTASGNVSTYDVNVSVQRLIYSTHNKRFSIYGGISETFEYVKGKEYISRYLYRTGKDVGQTTTRNKNNYNLIGINIDLNYQIDRHWMLSGICRREAYYAQDYTLLETEYIVGIGYRF